MDDQPRDSEVVQLKQQITYPLARVNAQLTAQATRVLRKYSDLTLSQWRLLVVLDSMGPCSMADFIRFTEFDKGQMSRVAQDLIQRGMITSVQSETNQRVQILDLTALGRAEFERVAPHMKRRRDALAAALTEAERALFLAVLEKIAGAATAFDDQI